MQLKIQKQNALQNKRKTKQILLNKKKELFQEYHFCSSVYIGVVQTTESVLPSHNRQNHNTVFILIGILGPSFVS